MIVRLFRPNETADSVFAIDYDRLWNAGKRALIFDLDKTLTPWQGETLSPAAKALLDSLTEKGFRIAILSNRNRGGSNKDFLTDVPFPVVRNAGKPRSRAFCMLLDQLKAPATEAVMIGDRWLTDVLGANRLGIHSVRVRSRGAD